MKKILFITLGCIFLSCSSNQQKPLETKEIKATSGEMIFQGPINMANLQSSKITSWFNPEFDRIDVDPQWVKNLKPHLKGLKIKIFMGTWCEDSQREVPHFYKIVKSIGVNEERINMVAVSHDKDTPQGYEKELNIAYVPTFIFYKQEQEIGRFVEYAQTATLEEDILTIVTNKAYTPAYAE